MLLDIFHLPLQIHSLCSAFQRLTFCLNRLPYPLTSGWIQPMGGISKRQERGRAVSSGCLSL